MAEPFDWTKYLVPLAGAAMGASGAGPQVQTTVQDVPDWALPPMRKRAAVAGDLVDLPWEQRPFPAVAPFTPDQFAGMDMMKSAAMNSAVPWAAQDALAGFLGGGRQAPTGGSNPYMGQTTSVGTNPYSGANPYLEQNINRTLGDVTRSYNQNVVPAMDARAYKGGSFGNTGNQEMVNTSRDMLQKNLGDIAGNMRMQDYGMQQQLSEADINRRVSSQLQDYMRNANLYESGANRALSAYQTDTNAMLTALGMSPTIYGLSLKPGETMFNIGKNQQNQAQLTLADAADQWKERQQWPAYMFGATNFSPGGGTTTTTSPGGSPAAGAIGGAGMMQWLFNNLFNTPKPPGT